MKSKKGAVLVLGVLIMMMASTLSLFSYSEALFRLERDSIFAKYYGRAIASALSCREIAMARLSTNFLYRARDLDIDADSPQIGLIIDRINDIRTSNELSPLPEIQCRISVSDSVSDSDISNSRDIYVEVKSTGRVFIPKFLHADSIEVTITSRVLISYGTPTILFTRLI